MTSEQQDLVNTVLTAYGKGIFPMADPDEPDMGWYCPDPRAIIPLTEDEGLHLSRSLRRRVRSNKFVVTTDQAFGDVIRGCAELGPGREETWIDGTIAGIFELLYERGHAHSIEVWLPDASGLGHLVGGLYGLAVGGAFCAESMFSRPERGGTDASKVAVAHLVHHLRRRGFAILDVQFWNEHIDQFGCVEIPREKYLERLADAQDLQPVWEPFEPNKTASEI